MNLAPHKITAIEGLFADAQASGKNIVVGAVVIMYQDAVAVTLFDDAAGSNGSTAKVTDANGEVVVWLPPGEYTKSVNGSTAKAVVVTGNINPNVFTAGSVGSDFAYGTPVTTGNCRFILPTSGGTPSGISISSNTDFRLCEADGTVLEDNTFVEFVGGTSKGCVVKVFHTAQGLTPGVVYRLRSAVENASITVEF